MNVIIILGLIYLVSLLLFRWFVKIDIRNGYIVPPKLALFFVITPIINTLMVVAWCISAIKVDLEKIAEKFFREKF